MTVLGRPLGFKIWMRFDSQNKAATHIGAVSKGCILNGNISCLVKIHETGIRKMEYFPENFPPFFPLFLLARSPLFRNRFGRAMLRWKGILISFQSLLRLYSLERPKYIFRCKNQLQNVEYYSCTKNDTQSVCLSKLTIHAYR